MRILLTGASSLTGFWFATRLAGQGHTVVATFTHASAAGYTASPRRERVAMLGDRVEPVWGVRLGDDRFLGLVADGGFDVVALHGADVTDYQSADFNICRAVANNTHRIVEVLRAVRDAGARVLLTGSVFEGGEGAGSEGLPHVSPYGMSKAITSDMFDFYARREGVLLGKFVIPNPFGPHEEPRFTGYLIRTWRAGDVAVVRTPLYVRDNVHVTLLAAAYERFAGALHVGGAGAYPRCRPSQYAERQSAFAERFARQMRPRLGLRCELEFATQVEFTQPRVRINTDPLDGADFGWDEGAAWDGLAEYYLTTA